MTRGAGSRRELAVSHSVCLSPEAEVGIVFTKRSSEPIGEANIEEVLRPRAASWPPCRHSSEGTRLVTGRHDDHATRLTPPVAAAGDGPGLRSAGAAGAAFRHPPATLLSCPLTHTGSKRKRPTPPRVVAQDARHAALLDPKMRASIEALGSAASSGGILYMSSGACQ